MRVVRFAVAFCLNRNFRLALETGPFYIFCSFFSRAIRRYVDHEVREGMHFWQQLSQQR